jgi:glucosamine--fructose-6-phosphate aminotransferase (isomerizing)
VPTQKLRDRTLVVAISQSGETADTLNAVRALRAGERKIVGITNVPESSLARESDHVLYTAAGPEVAVGATKTFTTQLVALALLAAHLTDDKEKAETIRQGLRKLPAEVENTIQNTAAIKAAAKWLARYENMFIVARGGNYPVALEAALKLKEIAYIHAEGVPAGELKHGPFALLGSETPVMALVASDSQRTRMITAMREIAARGAPVITLTDRRDAEIDACSELVIEVPASEELLTPVVFTVVSQLLSYYVGLERGCSIDRPRNLAKSVTVL